MSKTKEFYHEEICRGMEERNATIDLDYFYEKEKNEKIGVDTTDLKEHIELLEVEPFTGLPSEKDAV